MPYTPPEMLDDAMAVLGAASRGAASGHIRVMDRDIAKHQQAHAFHTAAHEEAKNNAVALAKIYGSNHPEVLKQVDAFNQHGQAAARAAVEAGMLSGDSAVAKQYLLPGANQTAARTAVPSFDMRDPRLSELGKRLALATATAGLQYGAQRGLEAINPDVSWQGSAAASAGGALAGRALVRGYEHLREQEMNGEKRAYGVRDLTGDALASLGAGARGYAQSYGRQQQGIVDNEARIRQQHEDSQARILNHQAEQARAHDEVWRHLHDPRASVPSAAELQRRIDLSNTLDKQAPGLISSEADLKRQLIAANKAGIPAAANAERLDKYAPAMWAGAGLAGAVPVGDHTLATPMATLAGQGAAEALVRHYLPNGSPMQHGLANAGGALAGRMALRGWDALTERSAPHAPLAEILHNQLTQNPPYNGADTSKEASVSHRPISSLRAAVIRTKFANEEEQPSYGSRMLGTGLGAAGGGLAGGASGAILGGGAGLLAGGLAGGYAAGRIGGSVGSGLGTVAALPGGMAAGAVLGRPGIRGRLRAGWGASRWVGNTIGRPIGEGFAAPYGAVLGGALGLGAGALLGGAAGLGGGAILGGAAGGSERRRYGGAMGAGRGVLEGAAGTGLGAVGGGLAGAGIGGSLGAVGGGALGAYLPRSTAGKILGGLGGAAGGAILGGVLGTGTGAVLGAGTGATAGYAHGVRAADEYPAR